MPEPSTVHKLLVHFIQTVYGPSWFNIKREKSFVEAPQLTYKMVQAAKSAKAGEWRREGLICLRECFAAQCLLLLA